MSKYSLVMDRDISTQPAKVNLGCGRMILPGWINIDRKPGPGVDIVQSLEACDHGCLPLGDNSVDEFLLSHILEHIRDTLGLMQELHRIAKPGAHMEIRLPYGSTDDAFEDPTHVRPYFLNSFGYFSQPFYHRADYGYRGDWQVKTIQLEVGSKNVDLLMVHTVRNVVREMIAHLEARKPIREPRKELEEEMCVELFVRKQVETSS